MTHSKAHHKAVYEETYKEMVRQGIEVDEDRLVRLCGAPTTLLKNRMDYILSIMGDDTVCSMDYDPSDYTKALDAGRVGADDLDSMLGIAEWVPEDRSSKVRIYMDNNLVILHEVAHAFCYKYGNLYAGHDRQFYGAMETLVDLAYSLYYE